MPSRRRFVILTATAGLGTTAGCNRDPGPITGEVAENQVSGNRVVSHSATREGPEVDGSVTVENTDRAPLKRLTFDCKFFGFRGLGLQESELTTLTLTFPDPIEPGELDTWSFSPTIEGRVNRYELRFYLE